MRYHRLGQLPKTRHLQFRNPEGGLYPEELISTIGFSSIFSLLHTHYRPTEVKGFEDKGSAEVEFLPEGPLHHRHFKTARLTPRGDAVSGRVPLMGNSDCLWNQVYAAEQMPTFYKNAEADEIVFVHDGEGELQSNFGTVPFRPGDYLVVPRGVIWRLGLWNLPVRMIIMESHGPVEIPRRYRNEYGQMLEHAPYCERDFRPPTELVTHSEREDHQVLIKARNRYTMYTYPYHPLQVVGWDGYVYPYAFNIHDFCPIVGKVHMPPPIHQTFHTPGFVVCSFCPRVLDFHPEAVPIPYNHSNVDSDEVLYYCNDKFGSRRGIEEGSITLHPLGIPHGPQPGAEEASLGATRTEELAVMMDTFKPLRLTKQALEIEDGEYWKSWQSR
ncbi:MAG: homogentisate 1,2-dioxygenase [Armatimonadetes bacterium]|nr:homogentisate 1,2-dioxygenase [Armatimonadota bacterium]